MLLYAYNPSSEDQNKEKYRGKLWCLGIKKYKKPSKLNDDQSDEEDVNEYIFNGIESKENEKEIDENIFNDENEYKGYQYFYRMYDLSLIHI